MAWHGVVIDRLFAGGNLGGVRITGRRRGVLEERLNNGLAAGKSHDIAKAKLNEGGDEVEVQEKAAASEVQFAVQPAYPAGDFHDSLQYHFFCGPFTIAGRVLLHSTLNHSISKEPCEPQYT